MPVGTSLRGFGGALSLRDFGALLAKKTLQRPSQQFGIRKAAKALSRL
jgi:hypothetical protein